MASGFRATYQQLVATPPEAIVGRLATLTAGRNQSATPESLAAWRTTLRVLRDTYETLTSRVVGVGEWPVILEYEVPRRDKHIDIVILSPFAIIPIEMKAGSSSFLRADLWQTERYALDLRDFHVESNHRRIAPILVATAAATTVPDQPLNASGVLAVACLGSDGLANYIAALSSLLPADQILDGRAWDDSGYRATPTIVQAAQRLYEQHDVRAISMSDATNLSETVDAVVELVERCRAEHRRGIAFITGSPGSGKTLAGLQVVHDARLTRGNEAEGIFLSGNRPLVEVISRALASSNRQSGRAALERGRSLETFIQHAYKFRNDYAERSDRVPPEHIVLFDEAQRAWDRQRVTSWSRGTSTRSEPEIFLDIMTRVPDWCAVIAMVGGGQEINRGEAGLGEWGRALSTDHPDWLVLASPIVLDPSQSGPGGTLFEDNGREVATDARLHLKMNVRSPRAERLNRWVDAVLAQDVQSAMSEVPDQREFPLVFTRSLDTAKQWLSDRAATDEHYGILASASDRRLRAWGLDSHVLQQEDSWADWFLRERGDVRSSCQLEVPATQFDCQGLELDWTCVCWGNDLTPTGPDGVWRTRAFAGNAWAERRDRNRQYLINGYRVLLTRARRGMIIWVPEAKPGDASIRGDYLDATVNLLQRAGLPLIS